KPNPRPNQGSPRLRGTSRRHLALARRTGPERMALRARAPIYEGGRMGADQTQTQRARMYLPGPRWPRSGTGPAGTWPCQHKSHISFVSGQMVGMGAPEIEHRV